METFSALLALCAGNSPVNGECPTQASDAGLWWFFFICAWINGWVNNRVTGDLRRHLAQYDVMVLYPVIWYPMMPPWHGNTYRIVVPLWGESAVNRVPDGFPAHGASDWVLSLCLCRQPYSAFEPTVKRSVKWDAFSLMWRYFNDLVSSILRIFLQENVCIFLFKFHWNMFLRDKLTTHNLALLT